MMGDEANNEISGSEEFVPQSPPVVEAEAQPEFPVSWLRRNKIFRFGFTLVSVAVVVGVAVGFAVKVPYVALVPGSARETQELLVIDGIETFGSEGELLYTTVRVKQEPNFWQYLWLRNDRDAQLLPEELVNGDRTADQTRDFNLELMTDAKSISVAVALEELGYDAVDVGGVIIAELVEGGAAQDLIEPLDFVETLDGEEVTSTEGLVDRLGGYSPGDAVDVGLLRADGTKETVEITLGANPDKPDSAFLGVAPQDNLELNDDLGFSIDIDSGDVGGPSAGLAFTLAVLDDLTPGELTGGERVAVTGTINVDGSVGPIGGIGQKVAVVGDLGIKNFIIPASLPSEELEAAFERAGDDVNLVPVENLEEALQALSGFGGDVDAVEEFAIQNTSTTG